MNETIAASATRTALSPKIRRPLIRIALVLVYFVLIFLLFTSGKGHILILDNQPMEGITPLPQGFSVSIDGRDPVSFSFGLDRDMAKVQGQNHHVLITGLKDGQTVSKDITIALNDEMAILSIAKLVAGTQPAVTTFVPKNAPPVTTENRGGNNQFTSPGSAEPGANNEPLMPDGIILP